MTPFLATMAKIVLTAAFIVSSIAISIAGAIAAPRIRIIDPDSFGGHSSQAARDFSYSASNRSGRETSGDVVRQKWVSAPSAWIPTNG